MEMKKKKKNAVQSKAKTEERKRERRRDRETEAIAMSEQAKNQMMCEPEHWNDVSLWTNERTNEPVCVCVRMNQYAG